MCYLAIAVLVGVIVWREAKLRDLEKDVDRLFSRLTSCEYRLKQMQDDEAVERLKYKYWPDKKPDYSVSDGE